MTIKFIVLCIDCSDEVTELMSDSCCSSLPPPLKYCVHDLVVIVGVEIFLLSPGCSNESLIS